MSLLNREKFEKRIRELPFSLQKIFFCIRNRREFKRWKKAGETSSPPRLIKEKIIDKHLKSTGYSILVETGTYMGDMIFSQLNKFKKIYSIELDEKLCSGSQKRFQSYRHIQIILGDSAEKIKYIIDQIHEPAIFWLDGHYSGGVTALGKDVTPIFEELKVIFIKKLNHILLIDDARLFTGRDGYPELEELKKYIFQYRPDCNIQVKDDCIQVIIK